MDIHHISLMEIHKEWHDHLSPWQGSKKLGNHHQFVLFSRLSHTPMPRMSIANPEKSERCFIHVINVITQYKCFKCLAYKQQCQDIESMSLSYFTTQLHLNTCLLPSSTISSPSPYDKHISIKYLYSQCQWVLEN